MIHTDMQYVWTLTNPFRRIAPLSSQGSGSCSRRHQWRDRGGKDLTDRAREQETFDNRCNLWADDSWCCVLFPTLHLVFSLRQKNSSLRQSPCGRKAQWSCQPGKAAATQRQLKVERNTKVMKEKEKSMPTRFSSIREWFVPKTQLCTMRLRFQMQVAEIIGPVLSR